MSDFVRVAATSDLADGEMRQVRAGGADVLLARVDGAFHACTAFCTHYGAPLADGVLDGTTVTCPWHHAAFDVADGALCQPPALDALRTFEVRVEGDDVLVRAPDDADAHGEGVAYRESDGAAPDGVRTRSGDDRLFLLLGGGAAAEACAETLRAEGYRGRLVMVTKETRPPYDRTKLSKAYLAGDAGDDALRLRDGAFYEARGVEVWTDRTVTGLDPDARTVAFEEGDPVTYDAALVATGGVPRRLDLEGADLDGVLLLRTWNDARALIDRVGDAESVAVIGASFIGMEAASSLAARGKEVTVVGQESVPFEAVLGADVGAVFRSAAEAEGVAFRLGAGVERIETVPSDPDTGAPRRLRVVAGGGRGVEAEVVVMGVGVEPATGFLRKTPLRRDDGGVGVDRHLRVVPGLFAAGDVAVYPEPRLGRPVRIEHWRLAQQHGRLAARNMLADADPTLALEPFEDVPFFWTGQFGVNLRYVGHAPTWDEVIVDGSLEDRDFWAAYVEGGAVRALAAVGRDTAAAAFHRLLARGVVPAPEAFRGGLDLEAALAEAG